MVSWLSFAVMVRKHLRGIEGRSCSGLEHFAIHLWVSNERHRRHSFRKEKMELNKQFATVSPHQRTPMTNSSNPNSPRPTGARHWVLAFAATLSIITYIDRVCISQAKGNITAELGLTDVQMGYAFAAFAWA